MVSTTHPPTTDRTSVDAPQSKHRRSLLWPLGRLSATTWMVLGLTLLGLLLRVWFIAVNELQPYYSPADDGDYYQRALRFATTGAYIDDFWLIRPPLHVWLFAGMIRLSVILGDVPGVALIRVLQTVMIVLTIPLGYGLAQRLFNRWTGLVFAGILAVWFPFVELPVHLFSEPSFFFFLVLHLWLLLVWRDSRRWWILIAAGVALGLASLARSPTLYSGAFVLLWLLLTLTMDPDVPDERRLWLRQPRSWVNALRPRVLGTLAVFTVACAVVVLPWTYRNYLTYGRPILIDTIGPVNLWLHIEKYPERGVEILKTMPQAERQDFAVADTARIFWRDPEAFGPLLLRNAGFHFQHIWKAQFVEDFFVKRSFYGRPLRETWLLGAVSDLLWFTFTLAGLVTLIAPLGPKERMFRWLVLCWVGYTIFAMMIMHIEPRYLLPVWLLLALYGSWLLANAPTLWSQFRQQRLRAVLAATIVIAFVGLVFSYRNYPQIIATGVQREMHNAAGMEALAAGDTDRAIAELEAAVALQPTFTETRANLALAQAVQGNYDAAWQVLDQTDALRMSIIRGMLERAQNDPQAAAVYFTDAETRSGEDAQQFAFEWLPVPPTTSLEVGNERDLGYVTGFLPGETLQQNNTTITYRWLESAGQVRLPLAEPLKPDQVVWLRLASGRPNAVPLAVTFSNGETMTVPVAPGKWRVYRLIIPPALAGQDELTLTLEAPIFIPAHLYPESEDARALSIMVGAVGVD